ncbi:hypothetical protein WN51_14176 [Melipona quadrifasciata]|uniref:Uncharacterized protein n=1 Tax=Melipona quadrifasciata TaxID=166423 RepID=A0A0M9A0W2_9HYME|nr:hypothetical protein WN51_14176 [Melipona quadrifasciata]
MAWFGDGLPSLSNLKGQLTSFTKEVLSEGIVDEMDERSRALKEANEKCVELQEILNSKDAEKINRWLDLTGQQIMKVARVKNIEILEIMQMDRRHDSEKI